MLLGAGGPALADVEIYRPAHRLPAELQELAAGVLGSEGSATLDPGSGAIVLHGSPQALARVRAVLADLDVPLQSFEIEYLALERSELEGWGLSVSGWVRIGSLRVGRGVAGSSQIELRAGQATGARQTRFRSRIAVREGSTADLWLERARPAAIALTEESDSEGRIFTVPYLRPVRSGFRVSPRLLEGGAIELRIQLIVSSDRLDEPIAELAAASELLLAPGKWAALGGVSQASSEASASVGDFEEHGFSRDQVLLVRVHPSGGP